MKKNKGFTLIELLVAIAIIAVLSSIVLAALGSSKNKGNDSKVKSHVKSMLNQAQLFTGTMVALTAPATAVAIPLTGGTNLFNDSTVSNNSLLRLSTALPTGTVVYYADENTTFPVAGGKWAFAASTSSGSTCIDYTGILRTQTTTVMTTAASPGASSAPILYPNLAGSYICN